MEKELHSYAKKLLTRESGSVAGVAGRKLISPLIQAFHHRLFFDFDTTRLSPVCNLT
jgi:hypothetical protein